MPEKIDDQSLIGIVNAEFKQAIGAPNHDISLERAEAYSYYLSKPFGNEEEGSSKVVTSDVADVVDGIMPSLLRIFTTADNLVSFDAVGPEDEQSAEQESDYVNYVFFKQNPSFIILFFWFFDALVQKNGIVKAWWNESEDITTETYEGLSESELLELLDDEELEPVERSEREDDTVDPTTNQIVKGIVHDITFRRIRKHGRISVENVPPEEYRISNDSRSIDPTGARMVGHEREVTRDELLAMGFSKEIVDKIPAQSAQLDSSEKVERRDKSDDQQLTAKALDRSQDKILLREAYIKVDFDGDGRSELRQIFIAGGKLLSNEPTDRQPFHVICAHPLPHKHMGRATAEKVMDVQLFNSTFMRQIFDNLYHTNRPGHAVWEQGIGENTMDDLLTTRVGRVARFSRPVGESWAPMTVPFTAAATFPLIEYFDKVKRDRTGVRADGEGLSPESLKNIQQSVLAAATDLSRMKIEAIARIFAETGIKSLFLHIHELVLKHQQKAQMAKLRNRWVPVNPKEWKTRFDMTVNIGLGIGTREANLLHLSAIWEKQMAMAQGGGMNLTVTPKNMFNTAAELVKNANLKQPEMFFKDPGDATGPPPNQEQIALQKQQQQLIAQQQQLDQERQQIQGGKLQLEAQKSQAEADFERMRLQLERQSLALEMQKNAADLRLRENSEENKLFVEIEKIKNQLTQMELASGRNVEGSRV